MEILEYILLGCSVYMFVLTVKMSRTREIPSFFVSNRVEMKKAKDKDGFIDYMVPRLYVLCASLAVFSIISIVSAYVYIDSIVIVIINVLYFVLLVAYCILSVKAQSKYLD